MGLFGQIGKSVAPAGGMLVSQQRLRALIDVSLEGLYRMMDSETGLLMTRNLERIPEIRTDWLSVRYMVMTAVGLGAAERAGFTCRLSAKSTLQRGCGSGSPETLDHLGMALWANAELSADLQCQILPKLLEHLDGRTTLSNSVGRELAWALTGLALEMESRPNDQVAKAALRLVQYSLDRCYSRRGGLFRHRAEGRRADSRYALFSTQIYWVKALAEAGRVFRWGNVIEIATRVADRLIHERDSFGGWPWRYDSETGAAFERYPIYSVHQDGMAPMALFALQRANGLDYRRVIAESLAWLWRNELSIDMVDYEHAVIFRAIRRKFPFNRLLTALNGSFTHIAHRSPLSMTPAFLRVNRTCRPYHLGWLLYALCPHVHDFPEIVV
ncbi:MAG: hypothetical protein HUU55_11290 [Myxococcales bacterium]|nr:hypothetical protein [Myxococcales bacterium]